MARLRRAGLAVGGGLLLYAGHPPLDAGWVAPLALVPLIALARDVARDPRAARAGLWWGFAAGVSFFLPLLEWLRNVQLEAWPLLAVVQALFVALFVAALAAWGERRGRAVMAVAFWIALELARSELPFGGFGWGGLGYTQAGGGVFLPVARSLGVLGVSAALAAVAVCVEEILRRLAAQHPPTAAAPAVAGLVGVLATVVIVGVDAPTPTGASVDVAAIQGLDLEGSTGRELPRTLLVADRMLEVTRRAVTGAAGRPDVVVWPENAIDGDTASSPELRARVEQAIAVLDGAPLVAGQIIEGPRPGTFHNTVALFRGSPEPVSRYLKRQYVPFGEYVPFRPLLGWYAPLGRIPEDGVPGQMPGVLAAGPARVGAVICFEVLFPGLVHDQVREGADVLVVATNNSSFGRGPASDQHIAISRLRAVETGRWVVHSALSGKSALVDPQGRVHHKTGVYEQAIVRADVPLVEGRTPAMSLGGAVGRIAQAVTVVGMLLLALERRRRRWQPDGAADRLPAPPDREGNGINSDAPVI